MRPSHPAELAAAVAAALCLGVSAPVVQASAPVALGGAVQAPSFGPERDVPRDIVGLARAELDRGVGETPRGSNDSPDIARYRGALTPRPRPAAWCAFFVSWVARTAGVPIGRGGGGIASVEGIRTWAQRSGRWTHSPRPGDVAIYSGHAGIVAFVSGSRMTTIEGNWSDRVMLLRRGRGEALGFARLAGR